MAGAQFERAMTLWSDLFQAAGENQRSWLNETYALTARATEEAAKLAAAATTSAAARQAAKGPHQEHRRSA
jgi:hypothetical protein